MISNQTLFRILRWSGIICWLSWSAVSLHAGKKEEYAGESDTWRRYASPHFELFSANGDQKSREVLNNLELLRALFFDAFKLKERRPLALTIYYFGNRKDFMNYVDARQRASNLAGFHLGDPDRAVIVLSPSWDAEGARHLIFHEYVHHLFLVSGEDPPVWFNEGVAELYSSLEVKSDALELGRPLPWSVDTMQRERLLPLATLFSVDYSSPIYNTGTHTGLFYAESWALLHFWYYGESKLNREKVGHFLNYIRHERGGGNAAERRKEFQDAMGMDYPAMEKLLEKSMQSGSYSWATLGKPVIPAARTYESRAVDLAEIRERLAELDLRVNRSGKAKLALLRAADQVPVKPRVLEALGAEAWAEREADQAYGFWQRSLDAGTENPAIYYEVAKRESERWVTHFDYDYRMPDDLALRLRSLLKKSIALTPDQSDAYEMLAWVEGTVASPDSANVDLVQEKINTLQHREFALTALALVRLHAKDREKALEILKEVEAGKPGVTLAATVKIIRSHISDGVSSEEAVIRPEPATENTPTPKTVELIEGR